MRKIGHSRSSTVWRGHDPPRVQLAKLSLPPPLAPLLGYKLVLGPRFRGASGERIGLGGGSLALASVAGSTSYDNR
jgi:hypothetical protein